MQPKIGDVVRLTEISKSMYCIPGVDIDVTGTVTYLSIFTTGRVDAIFDRSLISDKYSSDLTLDSDEYEIISSPSNLLLLL